VAFTVTGCAKIQPNYVKNTAFTLFITPAIFSKYGNLFPEYIPAISGRHIKKFFIMFKILIIDPNEPFRQSLKEVLASHLPFVSIETVADSDEGLEMIETFGPQLTFLEIQLPTTNGFDIARQIKAFHPDIILVILTSYDLPEYQEAAERAGVEHLAPKDEWTGEDMVDLVRSILASYPVNEHDHPPQNRPHKHSS
jgi:DNA-binding NarL/FixJ family response regulator